jgi:hypothetical protein
MSDQDFEDQRITAAEKIAAIETERFFTERSGVRTMRRFFAF